MIICTHFSGISGREVIATKDCLGTLTEQFNEATDFIFGRLHKSFSIKGLRRTEQLELPEQAVREIMLNAIVHRNYHIKAPTKVAIYQNRIEIFSPGNFPGPLNPHNLLQGITYIRNIAICKVFRESGYIEKLGSGFITTFESYAQYGLSLPQVIEGENYVKCILPRKQSSQDTKNIAVSSSNEEKQVLSLLQTVDEISMADIVENLHIPRATAGRRVADLVRKGLLKKTGKSKGTRYRKV